MKYLKNKKELELVMAKHPTNKIQKWIFEQILNPSTNYRFIIYGISGLIIVGLISTILGMGNIVMPITYLLSACILSLFGVTVYTVVSNNIRLRKIYTELGLTEEEYNDLVDRLFNDKT